jgi:hypothetical protein
MGTQTATVLSQVRVKIALTYHHQGAGTDALLAKILQNSHTSLGIGKVCIVPVLLECGAAASVVTGLLAVGTLAVL